ncbi:MAG: hypothetical protein J0L81_07320 [Caulobacterales bacterium]|jgi:hypothetical protein|nr:hypothetical protein [Caulobacterales bacterium]
MRWLSLFFAPELRAWRGQMTLWKVYWGYGVLTSGALALLLLEALRQQKLWIEQALLVAFALYTAWILIAVWRCAEHARPQWRLFARLSTVVWAGNALMVLGFLELDLLARLLGH